MHQVFRREIRANWKGLFFWCLGMFILAAVGFVEYTGMVAGADIVGVMTGLMPRIVRVMFGMAAVPINTPEGYFICMALWLGFIAYMHAAMLGAGLVAKEERDKTADFLFCLPVKRRDVLAGKMLAGVLHVTLLNLVAFGATLAFFLPQIDAASCLRLINLSMLGMLVVQLVFFFAGMCCAALTHSDKRATGTAAGIVLVTYFAMVLIEMADAGFLDFLTPFRYFYADSVRLRGLRPPFLALSAALATFAAWLTVIRYARRDLKN